MTTNTPGGTSAPTSSPNLTASPTQIALPTIASAARKISEARYTADPDYPYIQGTPVDSALDWAILEAEDVEQAVLSTNSSAIRSPAITMIGFLLTIYTLMWGGDDLDGSGRLIFGSILLVIVLVVALVLYKEAGEQDRKQRNATAWVRLLKARRDGAI